MIQLGSTISRKCKIFFGIPYHYGIVTSYDSNGSPRITDFLGRNKREATITERSLEEFLCGMKEYWIHDYKPGIHLSREEILLRAKSAIGSTGWNASNNCQRFVLNCTMKQKPLVTDFEVYLILILILILLSLGLYFSL